MVAQTNEGNHKGYPYNGRYNNTQDVDVGAGLVPAQTNEGNHKGYPYNGRPRLGDIIGAFKSETTHYYTKNVKTKNWPEFEGKLWQRNYYEHIIRNQKSLDEIRKYIKLNPYMWDRDRNNPKNWK